MFYKTKRVIRALADLHKAHFTDHISDLWNFIVSSEPVIDYTNATDEDKDDFRYKAISKWLVLNKQRMNLDFGYFDNSGSELGKILLDPDLRADNARIKPSETERQNLIKSYVCGIDEILSNSDLQKHKVLIDRTRELAREIEFLNPDLKDNDGWKKMRRKWERDTKALGVSMEYICQKCKKEVSEEDYLLIDTRLKDGQESKSQIFEHKDCGGEVELRKLDERCKDCNEPLGLPENARLDKRVDNILACKNFPNCKKAEKQI